MILLVLFVAVLTSPVTCNKKTCTKDIFPKNQRWVECELGFCAPKKCDDLGYPVACPGIAGPCPGGCVCIEGYLKNSEGVCIPQEMCPSCGGDYNATSGDGLYCGNLCSNYFQKKTKFAACRKQDGQYNACKCKKGFVFDDIIGRCVVPQDCPKPCNGDYYAVPNSCPSSCQPTCAYPEDPELCIAACNRNKCVCRDGYIFKERDGKCVKIEDCPGDLGCSGDPNAVITSCGSACRLTCEQLNKETEPMVCPAVCIPRSCTCKPSYIYSNKQGKCILESECSKYGCGGDPNAVKTECGSACPLTCEQLNKETELMACPDVCIQDVCTCKPSYIYSNKQGKCILESECRKSTSCKE